MRLIAGMALIFTLSSLHPQVVVMILTRTWSTAFNCHFQRIIPAHHLAFVWTSLLNTNMLGMLLVVRDFTLILANSDSARLFT